MEMQEPLHQAIVATFETYADARDARQTTINHLKGNLVGEIDIDGSNETGWRLVYSARVPTSDFDAKARALAALLGQETTYIRHRYLLAGAE